MRPTVPRRALYILISAGQTAPVLSVMPTMTAAAVFDQVKAHLTGIAPLRNTVRPLSVGGVAAALRLRSHV